MTFTPSFPGELHQRTAEIVRDFFVNIPAVDTVLVVNSCARGQAVTESDLDFAILIKPETPAAEVSEIENNWQSYASMHPTVLKYKQSSQFAHLHLDLIDGNYQPQTIEVGEPIDYFEIEIGNQICYSAPMHNSGAYFQELQKKWLPYYPEALRQERFEKARAACHYDLDHIPFFIRRDLYFQAFDILCKAFQEYLQTLFIANKIYPIAYNKWIKYQMVSWLNQPGLYSKLPPILSVSNLESMEINDKARNLRSLLNELDI